MLKNLGLLALSLAIALGLAELVLRQFYPPPPRWLEPQVWHLESPLLGWVLPPGERFYTIDAPVSINSHGLRDDEFPREKPPGEFRVLALGDSFTFGLGVRHEDLYTEQLERMLEEDLPGRSVQVINAGVAGYNTRQELIYLLAEGLSFDPDVITVGFYWNDLIGNEPPLPDIEHTPKVLPGAKKRIDHRHTIPRFIRDRLRASLALYLFRRQIDSLGMMLLTSDNPYVQTQMALFECRSNELRALWSNTSNRLKQIGTFAAENGIPTITISLPAEYQVRRDRRCPPHDAFLQNAARAAGALYLSTWGGFLDSIRQGQNPYLPYDLHPSPSGMRIIATMLKAPIVNAARIASFGSSPSQPTTR